MVAADLDAAGGGVHRGNANPAIDDEFLDRGVSDDNLFESFGGGFDNKEDADGLMEFHHLQREAGAEIAGLAVHDTDEAGDVMREFGAAAVAFVVDEGEIVFEADAAADGDDGTQERGGPERVRG